MKILISNDDGIHAKGIMALINVLKNEHDLYIVAPDKQNSAKSHSITMHEPIRIYPDYKYDIPNVFKTTGTPADCVKIALDTLFHDVKFDLVISGINNGANIGNDILYSGTVAASMEGAIHGFKAIAFSLNGHGNEDFTYAAKKSKEIIESIDDYNLPMETMLNVNFPNVAQEEIKGIKMTKVGKRLYKNTFEKRTDPFGRDYYWMGGQLMANENGQTTDVFAISNNYVSITPLHYDLTDYSYLDNQLGGKNENKI